MPLLWHQHPDHLLFHELFSLSVNQLLSHRCCSLCTRLPYLQVVVKNNLPNFVTGNKWIDPLHVIDVGWDNCDPQPHDSTDNSVNREETLLSHGFVVISFFLYWPFRQILTKWGHCYWVRHIYSGKEKIDNKKTLFAFHRFLSSWTPTFRKGNRKMVFVEETWHPSY